MCQDLLETEIASSLHIPLAARLQYPSEARSLAHDPFSTAPQKKTVGSRFLFGQGVIIPSHGQQNVRRYAKRNNAR